MLALNRLFRQNICSFCWRCCSASVGPHECFRWTNLHPTFGRTRSFHIPPPFPSFPLSAFLSLRPSEHWQCGAHGARRGLGDVLAALRTTPGLRQTFCRRTLWSCSGHIIQLVYLWKIHLWQTPQDVFISPDPFFRWKSDRFVAATVGRTSLLLGSPWLGGMGTR